MTFDFLLNLLVYLIIILIPLGQFSRLPIPFGDDVSLYLNDLLIPLFLFLFFINFLALKKKLEIPPFLGLWFLWLGLGLLGTTASLALGFLPLNQAIVGFLYWIRFLQYPLFFAAVFNLAKDRTDFVKTCITLMIYSGLVFAFLGFLQYRFFPDFSSLVENGWDPHYYRVLSTFFDPNFAGLFLTLAFLLIASKVLLFPKNWLLWVLGLFWIGAAIVLTFSRSTYLALATGLTVLGFLKAKKIIISAFIIGILVFLFVPRVQERVIGAINLDETAKLRLENYSKTLTIVKDYWLTGVGFNNFRFAQSYYGFFQEKRGVEQPSGHSGSGSDSSLLLVLATTGIFGLLVFIGLIGNIAYKSYKLYQNGNTQQKFLSLSLLSSLSAIIIHSQFVNSFFYPWIMLWLFLLLGLTYGTEKGLGEKESKDCN